MTMTSATAMYHDMNESDKFNSEKKQSRQDFIYIKKLAKQTYTIISQNSKYFREGENALVVQRGTFRLPVLLHFVFSSVMVT